jgi:quinone-modifying oxidoreductase subunit QmoB
MMPMQNIQPDPAFIKTQLAIDEWDKLPAVFDAFAQRIRDLGPNPYKGF